MVREYTAAVRRVIDGDTVVLRVDLGFDLTLDVRVRLLDVDAPETRGRDRVHGRYVRRVLADRIQGRHVVLRTHGKRDGFGRVLGRIAYRGEDVGAWLLAQGLAVKHDPDA